MTIYEREPRLLMMMGGATIKFFKEETIRRQRYEELMNLDPGTDWKFLGNFHRTEETRVKKKMGGMGT